ncbi:MAG: S41 family peptidase [Bacteroidales bacterium]|jgi:hypothetical protein|nr:S41 family peptidase [Bacteroidales bacterium]
MTRVLFATILVFVTSVINAQTKELLWPVKNSKTGLNILFSPNTYIDNELNFDNLFIGGKEGDTVIAPAGGKIVSYGYSYHTKLNYSFSFSTPVDNFTKDTKAIAESKDGVIKQQFVNVALGIKTDNGNIYISGLKPLNVLKTGQQIKKGDPIGVIGHSYHKIPEPSISVSISKKQKSADPMTPFGLKTTFIPPKKSVKKSILSSEEMNQDLNILTNAIKEGFPGLYDYITPEDFQKHTDLLKEQISNPLKPHVFENHLKNLMLNIHDFHLGILSEPLKRMKMPRYLSDIRFGWLNDTLIVTNTIKERADLIGKQIVSIDGISADSLKKITGNYIPQQYASSDAFVEAYNNYVNLAIFDWGYFYYNKIDNDKYSMNITFKDGSSEKFSGYGFSRNKKIKFATSWKKYHRTNWYKTRNFDTKILSDTIGYLGLNSFQLNDVELDSITYFVKTVSDKGLNNLIIDVRNNFGGDTKVIDHIYSLIADKPFSQYDYRMVNRRGNFKFMEYCLNYTNDYEIFPEFGELKEDNHYYEYNTNINKPDSLVNFKGRVYVLTNEISFSAATVFPAMVHKYRRGLIVGRETRGAYHQLKAEKFAQVKLPNSGIVVRIPLIKIVFDKNNNTDIPFGRGVMPDYPVKFSLNEMAYVGGDSILNYTRHLIAKDIYLKPLPEEKKSENTTKRYMIFGIIGIVLLTILVAIIRKQKK